jgi:hypothetical protein
VSSYIKNIDYFYIYYNIKMIVNNHWSLDFLLKNPGFELQDKIYSHNDKHTIVFFTINIGNHGGKSNMYQFIANGYILDDEMCNGICYFCEFGSEEMYKFYKTDEIEYCCKDCATLWKARRNVIKLSDNLYQCDNNVSKFKPDYIYHQIMYGVLYTPIDKFSYVYIVESLERLVELNDQHPNSEDTKCDLCTYDLRSSLEDEDWYGLYVCDKCISYAVQLIIEDNYPKYMLEKCLFDIDDINGYIMSMFTSLLI